MAAATGAAQNPVAYDIAPRGINLPSGLQLTRDDVDYVCTAVTDLLDTDPADADAHSD